MMRSALITAAVLAVRAFASPLVVATDNDVNGTYPDLASRATGYWYANMDHTGNARGYAPDLDQDYNYAVYKAVKTGDGNGIQAAINDGTNGAKRHGQWLASQPRVCAPYDTVLCLHGQMLQDADRPNRLCTSRPAPMRSARPST